MKWIDITAELTPKGQKELQTGQILFFDKVDLKIVRKAKGKVWAKRVITYFPEEIEITDNAKMDKV